MRLTISEKVFKEKNLEMGEIYASKQYNKEMYKKLAQLEDIEEDLGIDLITLFKALKDGVYEKTELGIIKEYIPCLNYQNQNKLFYLDLYQVKDYGKTWALTKEELE